MQTPFDSFQNNAQFDDAMRYSYMTQGRATYMPAPENLMPSQYGIFRNVPNLYGMPNTTMPAGLLSSLSIANQGRIPGTNFSNFFNAYSPTADYTYRITMASRAVSDKLSAIKTTAYDIGAGMGAFYATSAIIGGPLGLGLGAAAGMLTQPFSVYRDRMRYSRELQNLSAAKVFMGPDVSSSLNQGYSLPAATKMTSLMQSMAARDYFLKPADMQQMFRGVSEAGGFDYSLNVEQHKKVFELAVKNFKSIMTILSEPSIKEITKQFQRLNQLGAEQSNYVNIISKERAYSKMLGISHQELVNSYGSTGSMIYQQYGLTPIYGSLQMESAAGAIEVQKRLGLINAPELARLGGTFGAAQRFTTSVANVTSNESEYVLRYIANKDFTGVDAAKLRRLQRGEVSYTALLNEAGQRVKNPQELAKFNRLKPQLQQQFDQNLTPAQKELLYLDLFQSKGSMLLPGATRNDQLEAGINASVPDPEMQKQWYERGTNRNLLEQRIKTERDQLSTARRSELYREQMNKTGWPALYNKYATKWNEGMEWAFGTMLESAASMKDRKEQEALGIISPYDYGIHQESGNAGLMELENIKRNLEEHKKQRLSAEERRLNQSKLNDINNKIKKATKEEQEFRAQERRDIYGMPDINKQNEGFFSWMFRPIGYSAKEARDQAQFLGTLTMTPDDIREGTSNMLKKYSITKMQLEKIGSQFKEVGDINKEGFLKAVRKAGFSEDMANELWKSDRNLVYRYAADADNITGGYLTAQVRQDYEAGERHNIIQRRDYVNKLGEQYAESLESIAGTSKGAKDLKGVLTPRNIRIYEAIQRGGKDPATAKSILRWAHKGLGAESIDALIDRGEISEEFMQTTGMSKENIEVMKRVAAQSGDTKITEADMGKVGRLYTQYLGERKRFQALETISRRFGKTFEDADQLLKNRDQIDALLKSGKYNEDKDLMAILTAARASTGSTASFISNLMPSYNPEAIGHDQFGREVTQATAGTPGSEGILSQDEQAKLFLSKMTDVADSIKSTTMSLEKVAKVYSDNVAYNNLGMPLTLQIAPNGRQQQEIK